MESHNLETLLKEVKQKKIQLEELSQRIEEAILVNCMYNETKKKMNESFEELKNEMGVLRGEKQNILKQLSQFKQEFKQQFTIFASTIKHQYESQIQRLKKKLEKQQRSNSCLEEELSQKGRIIEEKVLEISVLKEKLKNNMNFIIDNCELHVTDLGSGSYHQRTEGEEVEQKEQSMIEFESESESRSVQYPQALFEEECNKFGPFQIQEQMEEACQNSFRIEHFNKAKNGPNTLQLRQNKDFSNIGLREGKSSQNSNEKDYFWKNMTCHISNPIKSCQAKDKSLKNSKNTIKNKQKQVLMNKITDFRKLLFLDKGISRFGFK